MIVVSMNRLEIVKLMHFTLVWLCTDISVPYVLVFGGTDLHCDVWNEEQVGIMEDVVRRAKYVQVTVCAHSQHKLVKVWKQAYVHIVNQ